MEQLSFFETPAPVDPPAHWLDQPTSIIVLVSGGIDSSAAAIWARRRWPERPLILWHAHLPKMTYPQDDEQITGLANALGNCRRVSVQTIYALNGERTPSGANGTTLWRLHTVRNDEQWFGEAQDDDEDAILTLLDFAHKARNGQPPTSKLRWCTSYFKSRACDVWLRENRAALGARPVLITGERHAESPGRAKLPAWQWRFGTKHDEVLWLRPVIDLCWHHAVQMSVDAHVPIHPAYEWQGETLDAMLDGDRDERGRARLSCACCIFTHQRHIQAALTAQPAIVAPFVRDIQQFEADTGYTWQQRGALLAGETP